MSSATSASAAPAADAKPKPSTKQILNKAMTRALGGGAAGAMAMFVNVGTLMWIRTTTNYQYRTGVSLREALSTLYKEGGVRRFYRGVLPALAQGPLSRFGDTAANTGILTLMDSYDATRGLPVLVKTSAASLTAALWRIFLMPIDSLKTTLQAQGKDGVKILMSKAKTGGPAVFYHGALAASTATFVGHWPWFATYNSLQAYLPKPDGFAAKLGRNAVIGFVSSAVSDTISNAIRVVKVKKQTSVEVISYPNAVRQILAEGGVTSLFFRGLQTKILANGLQGLLFSVLWKLFEEKINAVVG